MLRKLFCTPQIKPQDDLSKLQKLPTLSCNWKKYTFEQSLQLTIIHHFFAKCQVMVRNDEKRKLFKSLDFNCLHFPMECQLCAWATPQNHLASKSMVDSKLFFSGRVVVFRRRHHRTYRIQWTESQRSYRRRCCLKLRSRERETNAFGPWKTSRILGRPRIHPAPLQWRVAIPLWRICCETFKLFCTKPHILIQVRPEIFFEYKC